MIKIKNYLIISIVLICFASLVLAEETNSSVDNSTAQTTYEDNTTEPEPITDYEVTNIVPQEFNIGDAQFNIQVENIGTTELNNLFAIVSGKGFATYNIFPIDSLKQNEKSYIIVMGNFKEAGDIILTIKIEDKTFHKNVIVVDPNAATNLNNQEELKKAQEEAKKELENFSAQLNDLTSKYKDLELDLENKTNSNYDVSDISLGDLKAFLRDTQSYIIQKDVEKAKADLILAQNEYNDLLDKLNRSKVIQRSFSDWLKDNAAIISAILASLVAFFTLYEILKKKKEHLYEKIKEMKVNKDTRIVLEKKRRKSKKSKEVSEEKKEE
jgi:hypothetical protein